MKLSSQLVLMSLVGFLVGCGKPNVFRTFLSPIEGVSYTVETTTDRGLASNTTRVFANLRHDSQIDKAEVLEGDDIVVKAILWPEKNTAIIYINKGFLNSFHEEVSLKAGSKSLLLRNKVKDH